MMKQSHGASFCLLASRSTRALLKSHFGRVAPSLFKEGQPIGDDDLVVATSDELAGGDTMNELKRSVFDQVKRKSTPRVVLFNLEVRQPPAFKVFVGQQVLSGFLKEASGAHVVPEPFFAEDTRTLGRLLRARAKGVPQEYVAAASIQSRTLLVWDCEPRRFQLDVDDIPALRGLTDEELAKFQISDSGSRIHWESHDIDLNMDTVRAVSDPSFRKKQELQAREEARQYADSIRVFRMQSGLKQTEMGIDPREVRRIEKSEVFPRAETLRKLAAAHKLEVNDYLRTLARLAASPAGSSARRPAKGKPPLKKKPKAA